MGVTSGGKLANFRMEHVWVEAAIDFQPSRGAINKSADTWVALDPSFKQYQAERGYDMYARLNFDSDAFLADYIQNGATRTPYQHYSKKVLDYLNANIPDWTLVGLYGHERVDPIKPPVNGNLRLFAASLPYRVLARGYMAATVPDNQRHKVSIGMGGSVLGPDVEYTISFSELGLNRLTLSYIPESAADDAVVADYESLFATPAYLVRLKPVLRKGGTTVAVGSGATLGAKQTVSLSFQSPTISISPVSNKITVGSYSAIVFEGIEATRGTPSANMQLLAANAERNEQTPAEFDDLLGQLVHAIGIQWFFNLIYERDFYAATTEVIYTRLPSEAIATADLTVSYFFGFPRSASPGPFTVDADQDVLAAAPIGGDSKRVKDFMLLAGMSGSAWEHLVFEGFFDSPAVSSMKLLRAAADQGIPIYKINSSNIAQILPQLALSPEDITDIQNGVNSGKIVTASQTEVQVGSYRGAGILILDPQRGNGLYLISGGLAGGSMTNKEAADRWKKEIYTSRFASLLRRAFIVLWATSKVGTPYGLGCKLTGRNYDPCPDLPKDDPNYETRVDCSGLVAYAYGMVGFSLFHDLTSDDQMRAIGSWDFGTYPTPANVKLGDLNFWCCTLPRPASAASHVGIYIGPGRWIAAQGNEVNFYNSMPAQATFLRHGSIFKH